MSSASQPHSNPVAEYPPFEPKALLHRHGGRIASLLRIEHVTEEGGRATWFFIGTVDWFDGASSGQEVDISPTSLVTEDDAGKAEWDLAMEALSGYLIEHGQWGEQGHWKPKVPFGSAPVAIAPR